MNTFSPPLTSSGGDPSPQPTTSIIFTETTFLFALRLVFFLLCRHYVNLSLFSDLRSVIHEDSPSPDDDDSAFEAAQLDDAENGAGGGYRDYVPLVGTSASGSSNSGEAGPSGSSGGSGKGGGGGGGISSTLPLLSPKSRAAARFDTSASTSTSSSSSSSAGLPILSERISPPPSPSLTKRTSIAVAQKQQQNVLYPRMATSLFCLCFSESCMLFTLVLFGEGVSDRSRALNWSISLLLLLSLIIFIIPLGLCLLLTHRSRSTPPTRTLLLTAIPFGLYLFVFYRVGSWIAEKVVVEGSHSLGVINALLSRVCAPGVMMIASLSGGGAVSTAWEAFEWRVLSSAEPVTESQILSLERTLYRTRLEIHQRTLSLSHAEAALPTIASSKSSWSRWTNSNPAQAHLESLRGELAALERLEGEIVEEVGRMRRRRELMLLRRTVRGRVWLAAGWGLSVYCVWRVFISCVNLIFGYSQKHHHRHLPSSDPTDPEIEIPIEQPPGTDLITSLLGRLALLLKIDIDVASWSRLIGLVLIATIILANMRNVLGSVSRIFKATSTGVSASFMLLFLAQLMSMYLLTSLISLPSSPSESSSALLDTLPDFNVFSRLFDSVFLIAAGGVFAVRWVQRKLRVGDD